MGLDMNLYKKHFIWSKDRENMKISGLDDCKIKSERVQEITEDVMYWRKANAIHAWFVENVQGGEDDCKEYSVSREQLKELQETCEKVLASSKLIDGKIKNGQNMVDGKWVDILEDGKHIEDITIAKDLLPTEQGFFFGGIDYDEYYYDSIKETAEKIKELLAEGKQGDFYYSSSW